MKTRKTAIALLIALTVLLAGSASNIYAQQYASIGQGILHILGIDLSVDPEQQTAPINTGTAVNTNMIFPDIDLGGDVPLAPDGLMVVAELTGPGITTPKTISARPGEQLMIPPLPQEGTYVLDNIRLMSGNQVILYAEPSMATIDTIKKLLITQVISRALSIDEIEDLGITINPENFTAYKFTVGFGTETGTVKMEIPVIIDNVDDEDVTDYVSSVPPYSGLPNVPGLNIPNIMVKGIKLDIYEEEFPSGRPAPIAGVIVIPGNIAFLNQFFEVMLLVTNNAPDGTPLVVTNINAEILLPAGEDNIPHSIDDPLRIAQREEGTASVVPVLNAGDKGPDLAAQESGEGKFYLEGLKEGTHEVEINITGILQGLPSGPVEVKGTAIGTVLVRNPNFSLTFGQPDVVREGEEYSLFVTVNNISQVDANLVKLNLSPAEIYGATLVGDSDSSNGIGTVEFRTVKAGDSAVAEFKLIARKTGRVTSTAFQGVEGVQGVFRLRTGVDERGVPLSPDSLALSSYANNLPQGLLYEAMRVLGLAHSVATAPSLPSGVSRMSRSAVVNKAYQLTEAGLRIQIGESVENSVYDLLMDWLGNGAPDKGFDEILRSTDAGNDFLFEAGKIIGITNLMDAHRSFGDVVKYRSPFISAVVENTGQALAYMEITDNSTRSLGRNNDGSIVRKIPYGLLVDIDGNPGIVRGDMALLDSRTGDSYALKIRGVNPGLINFGLVLKNSEGAYVHAIYRNVVINSGETITGQIVSGADTPVLQKGTSSIYPTEVYTYPANAGPRVIGAMQLSEADVHDRGRVVAVLFDEKINPESANNPENYEVVYRTLNKELRNPPKKVSILPGKRIIEIMFQCTISPFFDYDLILSGIKDPSLNPQEPDPIRVPIMPTLTEPGGIVSGTVREGNGDPIPYTEVLLIETFKDSEGGSYEVITNRTTTDGDGNYQIDYVAMNSQSRVQSMDPKTGQTGSMSPRITMDRQHLVLDILLLGLGKITGSVINADDMSPVEKALITIKSMTDNRVFLAKTDENGKFALTNIPVGNLFVSAEKDLYSGTMSANIPFAGESTDITITIYNREITGSLKGRVFEFDGTTPVPGVPVIITKTDFRDWQYSDENGYFSFEKVPEGNISLSSFVQETGEQAKVNGLVSRGQTTTLNLVFPGTSTIIGTVYNHKGETVSGAQVVAGVTLVETDENGNFTIDRVPVGSIKIAAADQSAGIKVTLNVDVGTPGEVVRVNITLTPPVQYGTIQGYVRDPDGKLMPYQRVIMYDGGTTPIETKTDGNGFFQQELRLTSYSVRTVNSDLTDGDLKNAHLVLDGQVITVELKYKGFGRITGTVYQPDGVSPIVASVLFSRTLFSPIGTPYLVLERHISDQLTEGGVNGKYTIEKVRVGDFRLEASNAFYSDIVAMAGKINHVGETVIMDIVLKPTSTVRGQVFLANGERAGAGLPVTLSPTGLFRPIDKMQVLTRDDGTFEFNLVPPVQFALDVLDTRTGNRGVERGSVETGDAAEVDIHMLGQGIVNVKVINGAGDPVSGARVKLNSGSDVAYLINEYGVCT